MSLKSPFKDFYNKAFSKSHPKSQADFLRKLFTRDGGLCASYLNYIYWIPDEDKIAHLKKQTINRANFLRERTVGYNWKKLFEIEPKQESYEVKVIDCINSKLIDTFILRMEASCRIGELLNAISQLRIIESGLNIDWKKVGEPASRYRNEISHEISFLFDHFSTCFMSHIFCVEMIEEGVKMIKSFIEEPGEYFDKSENWQEIIEMMEHCLNENE